VFGEAAHDYRLFRSRPSAIAILSTDCRTFRQFLLYDYESLHDFVQHCIKACRQDYFFRINNYVCSGPGHRPSSSHSLPETPLHAIPLHRAPQGSTYGESNTKACRTRPRVCRLPLQIEHSHQSRKMSASLFIDALEIGVA
jgi:hypothetical protein